jgi:hypothetical protein
MRIGPIFFVGGGQFSLVSAQLECMALGGIDSVKCVITDDSKSSFVLDGDSKRRLPQFWMIDIHALEQHRP